MENPGGEIWLRCVCGERHLIFRGLEDVPTYWCGGNLYELVFWSENELKHSMKAVKVVSGELEFGLG